MHIVENYILDFREKILIVKTDEKILFLLVGNKCNFEVKRKVSYQKSGDRATQWSVPYVENSVKTGEHVNYES